MEYFLPIAEVYVSIPLIFILSLVVGILSGLFGVGGGFLMTPFLIFLGIPPAYAVPNEANNILGTSISDETPKNVHYARNNTKNQERRFFSEGIKLHFGSQLLA